MGSQCFDHTVSAAHFQLRLARYYSQAARPPLREAFFIVTLPPPYLRELLYGCPGLVIMSHLLVAEARLATHGVEECNELVARAKAMMAMPEIAGVHLHGMEHAWSLQLALARLESLVQKAVGNAPLSLDIVVPRCREGLEWLGDASKLEVLPPRTRVFVYEKCGRPQHPSANLTDQVAGVKVIHVQLDDAADPHTGLAARRDECTAYLTHVVRNYHSAMADVTLFVHGDPGDHTPFGLLNLLMRGLALGTLHDLEFIHLGSPRMVYTSNPCQAGLFQAAFGRPLEKPLSTYCCSQFAVSKSRIRSRPWAEYARILKLVDGSMPDVCDRIGPAYEQYRGQRLSHCYFLEFMWHVVFGESEDLPLRADDTRLPLALRLKDNEESMPSVWRSYISPFVGGRATFAGQGHAAWIQSFQQQIDLGQKSQLNYGDLVEQ